MRKKFIDKVYMREVIDKEWYVEKDEKFNGYIALKYIKEISKPLTAFSNGKKYISGNRCEKGVGNQDSEIKDLPNIYKYKLFLDKVIYKFKYNNKSYKVKINKFANNTLFAEIITE